MLVWRVAGSEGRARFGRLRRSLAALVVWRVGFVWDTWRSGCLRAHDGIRKFQLVVGVASGRVGRVVLLQGLLRWRRWRVQRGGRRRCWETAMSYRWGKDRTSLYATVRHWRGFCHAESRVLYLVQRVLKRRFGQSTRQAFRLWREEEREVKRQRILAGRFLSRLLFRIRNFGFRKWRAEGLASQARRGVVRRALGRLVRGKVWRVILHWRERVVNTNREERVRRRVQHAVGRLAKRSADVCFRSWLHGCHQRQRDLYLAKRSVQKMLDFQMSTALESWRDEATTKTKAEGACRRCLIRWMRRDLFRGWRAWRAIQGTVVHMLRSIQVWRRVGVREGWKAWLSFCADTAREAVRARSSDGLYRTTTRQACMSLWRGLTRRGRRIGRCAAVMLEREVALYFHMWMLHRTMDHTMRQESRRMLRYASKGARLRMWNRWRRWMCQGHTERARRRAREIRRVRRRQGWGFQRWFHWTTQERFLRLQSALLQATEPSGTSGGAAGLVEAEAGRSARVVISVLQRKVEELTVYAAGKEEEHDSLQVNALSVFLVRTWHVCLSDTHTLPSPRAQTILEEQQRELAKYNQLRAENRRMDKTVANLQDVATENAALRRELERQRIAVEKGQRHALEHQEQARDAVRSLKEERDRRIAAERQCASMADEMELFNAHLNQHADERIALEAAQAEEKRRDQAETAAATEEDLRQQLAEKQAKIDALLGKSSATSLMIETGYEALLGESAAAGMAGGLMVSLGQGEARRTRSVSPVEKAMLERAGLNTMLGGVIPRGGYRGRSDSTQSPLGRYSSRSPTRRSQSPNRRGGRGGRSMSPASHTRQLDSRSPSYRRSTILEEEEETETEDEESTSVGGSTSPSKETTPTSSPQLSPIRESRGGALRPPVSRGMSPPQGEEEGEDTAASARGGAGAAGRGDRRRARRERLHNPDAEAAFLKRAEAQW